MARRDGESTGQANWLPPGDDLALHERLVILGGLFVLIAGIVGARLVLLMVVQAPTWREKAEANFLHTSDIAPVRGAILDRTGALVAVNRPVYDIALLRYRMNDVEAADAYRAIAQLVPTDSSLPTVEKVLAARPTWRPVPLLRNLSPEAALPLLESGGDLPGLRVTRSWRRSYPLGRASAPWIGYLKRLGDDPDDEQRALGYQPGDWIGSTGLESAWEASLRGIAGWEWRTKDALERDRDVDVARDPRPGDTLELTIDARVQRAAYAALDGRPGAVVAMDPRDGAILAMISSPSFDPETRVVGPGDSAMNRVTASALAPASTIKIFSALAFLAEGIAPEREFSCEGSYRPPGWDRAFYCDNRQGHGMVNMREMLQTSCNVYVYKAMREVGARRLESVLRDVGMGAPTGFAKNERFGAEATGTVPKAAGLPAGEVLMFGIGQGRFATTPLQLAAATSAFANGGTWRRPYLAARLLNGAGETDWQHEPASHPIAISAAHRAIVLDGMRRVCQQPGGTAYAAHFPSAWDVAGKTGTAEREDDPDAWFIGFAPARAPEIVVVVRVEKGGHGGAQAAPIARSVLNAWFNRNEPAPAISVTSDLLTSSQE